MPNNVKHFEHALGFEVKFLSLTGLSPDRVHMVQTKNTRRTNETLERNIKLCWEKNKQNHVFDGDRARFEGTCYDEKADRLELCFSHEKYRTYFYTRDKTLQKPYQAQLLSINGVVVTRDNLIPIGFRTARTNQEGIWHIVPAGYIDVKPIDNEVVSTKRSGLPELWSSETPYTAAERELHEELFIPAGCHSTSKMRLIGIVFNYCREYDTTICIVVPVDCASGEIRLRGDEHESLRFLKTSLNDMKRELIQLSRNQSISSGHLRGDIALTIAHLYGYSEYVKAIASASREASRKR